VGCGALENRTNGRERDRIRKRKGTVNDGIKEGRRWRRERGMEKTLPCLRLSSGDAPAGQSVPVDV